LQCGQPLSENLFQGFAELPQRSLEANAIGHKNDAFSIGSLTRLKAA
jgi:hypothetical protein